uniref:Uncharacterized protein n=1 Tax=Myotis myotis TaxID=51298 RepID=A0A7J7ZX59_MYOMY|nr:hypothetical protein mMyoMyo1_009627 [Myotis myotis]
MVCIETAGRAPVCHRAPIPHIPGAAQACPPECEDSAAPSCRALQGGSHPESPAGLRCLSRALPHLQFQQDWGRGESPGPQASSRKIYRLLCLFQPLPSWLQQTLLLSGDIRGVTAGKEEGATSTGSFLLQCLRARTRP